MFKSKEEFLETRRKKEEVEKLAGKKVEKLKDNIYFTNLIENRKKLKELNEKSYKMQVELNNLKNEIEKTEQEEGYQVSLQNWTNTITLDSFKHDFNEYYSYGYNLDYWQLFSPLVDISIHLKERRELKVWKFEVTSSIKHVKNLYEETINTDVVKFKTKQEALKRVEELKQELFNRYAEDFTALNNDILLANEVKKAFEGVDRSYMPNELQRIVKKNY